MTTQTKAYRKSLKTLLLNRKFALSAKMIIARTRVMNENRRNRANAKRAKALHAFLDQVHFEQIIANDQIKNQK